MKIVIDARIIGTPTGRYVYELIDHLQDIDTENQYIVLVKLKDINVWKPRNKNFSVIKADYNDFTFSEQIGFLFFLKKLQPDLVHFTMPQQPLLYRGTKITTVHDLTLLDFVNARDQDSGLKHLYKNVLKPFIFSKVIRSFVRSSDMVITPTNWVKKDIQARVANIDTITVTYESSNQLSKNPAKYSPVKDEKFILFVGNTPPYKNIERLLEAMRVIKEETGTVLLLVGKKNDFTTRLQAKAKELGLNDETVRWTGFVSDAELAWLYKNTSAYVVPSLSEGFGLPGLEAMLHGAPVASSNATCLPEVYQDAAHYFNPLDTDDIASKIIELINDSKLQSTLKKNANKLTPQYSWSKMAQETHDQYMDVLNKNS